MRLGKGKRLLILGAVLVVIDQVIKVLVKTNMSIGQSLTVFPDWFQILFPKTGMDSPMDIFVLTRILTT